MHAIRAEFHGGLLRDYMCLLVLGYSLDGFVERDMSCTLSSYVSLRKEYP